MGVKLLAPPDIEPITLAEARAHLRIAHTSEDSMIEAVLIPAARGMVEDFTGRSLIAQAWRLTLDAFPSGEIELPRVPVTSVTEVRYLDTDGVTRVLPSAAYRVALDEEPARVAPEYDHAWPETRPVIGAVAIDFSAGHEDAAAVPPQLRHLVLLALGHLYLNREAVVTGTIATELPIGLHVVAERWRPAWTQF